MSSGLRRFVGPQPEPEPVPVPGAGREKPRAAPGEACEMCAEPVGDGHSHVVNLDSRQIMCTCRACYLLFTHQGAAGGRYRAVPDRYLHDRSFQLDDGGWDTLQIPVKVAFFFHNSDLGRVVAFYPSPAGATESLLPLEAWQDVVAANPVMTDLVPDVEALLVQRARPGLRVLPGPDRRLLRAGRPGAHALEGLRRRRGGVGGHRRLLRRRPRPQPPGRERGGGRGPVTDLVFDCVDAQPDRYAAVPTLQLKLRISETTGAQVHAIALRCQIRIEPQRRRYSPQEADGLLELFGEPPRWGDTLKPMQFATVSLMVPSFTGSTEIDLPVPCTYDFEVAASKYLHALGDGEVPLLLLFSGTVFTKGLSGFSVGQVPWHKEATYRLPVTVWREIMDRFFPGAGWIRVRRDTLDALQRFKAVRALPTWDDALEALFKEAGEAGQ